MKSTKILVTVLSIIGILGLLMCLAILSSCGLIPPPHIGKPRVQVSYVGPKFSPDGKEAYFIKVVSQLSTRMHYAVCVFAGDWVEQSYLVWSKCYLCRSGVGGEKPVVVAELPQDKFRWENNFLYSGPVAFTVAWKQKEAMTVVNRLHDNISLIDLQTGKCRLYTISDPRSRSPTAMPFNDFQWVYIEPIEGDSKILWSIRDGVVGTLDFEGNQKVIDLEDHFESYSGHSPEQERQEAKIVREAHSFSWPFWNEQQGVFALNVVSRYRGGAVPHEIWVFNSKLELVEKVAFGELDAVMAAKRKNKLSPDHKYAWVVDRILQTEPLRGRYEEVYAHDTACYHADYVGGRWPKDFQLQNHTLEHTRINPKEAASLW